MQYWLGNQTFFNFPISSLLEEYNVGMLSLPMMVRDSTVEFVHRIQPDIKVGTKGSTEEANQEVKTSPWTEDKMGVIQTYRVGLGSTRNQSFFLQTGLKGKMRYGDWRNQEKPGRIVNSTAFSQSEQWAWTIRSDINPMNLSWNIHIGMELFTISFLPRSTYDLLNVTDPKL